MKTSYIILSAASIIPLLSGCASPQKAADNEAWSIKPTYNVRHSTETPESFYQLGRYYQGQNRYEQAIAAYQKALSIDGKFADAHNGLGVIFAMQGRHQQALEHLQLAVQHAPNAAHIHSNLGYALYLSESYAEAASTLERAVALEPSNQAAHTNLALALNKAGNREKAVQVMAQAAKPQPAENMPPVVQEVQSVTQEAPQVHAVAPALAPAPTVVTTATSSPSPAPQQVLALPKDWGVITQAARKQVPLVESRIQAVQVTPNVYELRERAEVRMQAMPATKPIQQASVQPDGHSKPLTQMMKQRVASTVSLSPGALPKGDRVAAQATQKPTLLTESRAQTAQSGSSVVKQSAQSTAPANKPYRIEVSNGNGVTGMARKVAGYLEGEGYYSARQTNQKPFHVASSQVQYRSGYREQAQSLALTLPGQPGITQTDGLRGDISVRILLGKDIASNVAYFERGKDKIRLVRQGSDS